MPLNNLQTEALQVLAGARDPESYVAGSTPLNVSSARYSADIDIFHDRAERIATQAESDAVLLKRAGMSVTWLRQTAFVHSATIAKAANRPNLSGLATAIFVSFRPSATRCLATAFTR